MRREDVPFWEQAKEAVGRARLTGANCHMIYDTRLLAALRQLVQRNWDRKRAVTVIDGLACGFYDLRTPRPQLVMNFELDKIIQGLLDAEYDIRETARRLNHTIYRESQGVQERLRETYPELYGDQADRSTESGDR